MGAGKIDGQMDFLGLIEEYTDDQGAIVRVKNPVNRKIKAKNSSEPKQMTLEFIDVEPDDTFLRMKESGDKIAVTMVPETAETKSEAPDNGIPETGVPGVAAPEFAVPEIKVLKTQQPESAKTEQEMADREAYNTVVAENTASGTKIPESAMLESAVTETEATETETAETETAETETVETEAAETEAAETEESRAGVATESLKSFEHKSDLEKSKPRRKKEAGKLVAKTEKAAEEKTADNEIIISGKPEELLFKQCNRCWCNDCRHNYRNEGIPRNFCGTMMACPACDECIKENSASICPIGDYESGCELRGIEEGLFVPYNTDDI